MRLLRTIALLMDPIGFSLENFDAIGRWRDHEQGVPVDASDVLYDGRAIDGPAGLRRLPASG